MIMNRRQLLKTGAQLGVLSALNPALAGCGGSNAKKIDVHHHAVPPLYVEALASIGVQGSGGMRFPNWSPQKSLNVMDFNNITTAVLSLSTPGTYFGDADFAVNLARQVNEYLALAVQEHPLRFGFFATLPAPLTSEAAAEAEYALDVLNADGVCLLASAGGVFLGDPSQDEILSVLDQRGATVFIHPNQPASTDQLGLSVPLFAVEFVIDTTRAVSNMIWNGTFAKFPNIKWIVAHAGGTMPFIAWRMSLLDLQSPELLKRSPGGTLKYLKLLYYDTALSPTANALFPILNQFGLDQLVLGTDYPFAPAPLVPIEFLELNAARNVLPNFCGEDLVRVYQNGYRLFPRLNALHFSSAMVDI